MIRESEIAKTFAEWLQFYSPPRQIAQSPEMMQKESERLLSIIVKMAPHEGYNGWVGAVLDVVASNMKTRAWPTVAEIGAACSSQNKSLRKSPDAAPQPTAMDVYELNANRMKAGEPVGEGYLYGKEAIEMIVRGLIDEATMTRYRSGAFFARKNAYGEEAALAWEAEAKQRHHDAWMAHKERQAA